MKTKQIIFLAIMAFSILTFSAQAQQPALKVPAPSTTQTLKQNFSLSDITIEYSRPSATARVIFGDVVPFGKTCRTGANAATKITFGEDAKAEDNDIPAGTYPLSPVPTKDSWDIIL